MGGFKPGGGGRLQPYIPSGNGERSGEYTNKFAPDALDGGNCWIRNEVGKYNFLNSKLVMNVKHVYLLASGNKFKRYGQPDSVMKKVINGFVNIERFYNEKGEAYLDIDYSDHGSPAYHRDVPHIHRWCYDDKGNLVRKLGEKFK